MTPSTVYNGQNSRIPNGRKQVQIEVSSDNVIFIANVRRHLMNIIKTHIIFHQALLVVTSNIDNEKISHDKKYHLVEFEDDSKAKYLNELTKFEDELYCWEKVSIKQQFDIDTLNITVNQIKYRMQDFTNQKGPYHLFFNNSQSVAKQLTKQLLLENIQDKNIIFLALFVKQHLILKKESSPHSALLVAAQKFTDISIKLLMLYC
ncbi:unnamed protein product [Paramecium pentaurelia]|uniref:Uncharacterized protein n=1 Tax=Paramecium pentaurelia TaxID=43138 RepID=A0A8S1VXV3_9CILI|nr:unnamed protein product [Paramecium pentaurelia]